MKKLFVLIAVFSLVNLSFGQQVFEGTVESVGGGESREILVNGLTQLYSVTGQYTLSADGAGSTNSSYSIDVLKPNVSATVYKAYLFGAPLWGNSGNCTQFNGQAITWDGSATAAWGCCNYYADVTAIVAAVIDPAGPGITSITVSECSSMDGYGLLVIFADALAAEKTIVIMFGGLSTTGDNFSLTLGEAIDPVEAGAMLDMGLGISFGAQAQCDAQYSIININGQRLTTSAGGEDDGSTANGALMTVGGIGDMNTNPADPFGLAGCNPRYDDELYSLLPLITNTTTNILVNTQNPSNNDNVFLAYFEISGAAIIGEGILLSQTENVNPVGTNHTVTALVQNDLGQPVVGTEVTFTVLSGPNAGETHAELTNANGNAFFTYMGDGGQGIDQIRACFVNSQQAQQCSNILNKEWTGEEEPVPVSNWALIIGILMIIGFAVYRFRR